MQQTRESDDIPPGAPHVPGYRFVTELGRGGMGIVYKAEQTRLGRIVAVKSLTTKRKADDAAAQRFINEARALATMGRHESIVQVYDVVTDEAGGLFIVMEFVEGRTLEEIIVQGPPVGTREAVRIVIEVARALHHAHERNIIHRDVKPANIMMTTGGEIRVMDFGLARSEDADSLTKTGFVVGTPTYMSPEQLQAVSDLDRRSDVYSLAVVLYHLICGKPPFSGETPVAIGLKHINQVPEPPSKFWPALPKELEEIILRGMQKKREDRFATCAEMAGALERFLNPENDPISVSSIRPQKHRSSVDQVADKLLEREVVLPPPPVPPPARRKLSKRDALLIAVLVVVITAGATVGVLLFKLEPRTRAALESPTPSKEIAAATPAPSPPPSPSPVPAATAVATPAATAAASPALPAAPLVTVIAVPALEFTTPPERVYAVAFSADGALVYSAGFDSTIQEWNTISGRRTREFRGHRNLVNTLCIPASGGLMISGSADRTAIVWRLDSGAALWRLAGHTAPVKATVLTRDGRVAITGGDDKRIGVWDMVTGNTIALAECGGGAVGALALVPDGDRFVAGAADGTLRVWSLESPRELGSYPAHRQRVTSATVSSDGRVVVSTGRGGTLVVMELATGRTIREVAVDPAGLNAVAISGAGSLVAAAARSGKVIIYQLDSGLPFATFGGLRGDTAALAWKPGSMELLTGGGGQGPDGGFFGELKLWAMMAP